jgi:hypothetical protein
MNNKTIKKSCWKQSKKKITLTFHLTPVRMSTKTPPPKNVGEDEGKKESSYTAGGTIS